MRSTGIEASTRLGLATTKLAVDMDLSGVLAPQAEGAGSLAELKGEVAFRLRGKLVGPLVLAPEPALNAGCTQITRTLLEFIGRNFAGNTVGGYRRWRNRRPRLR